MTVSFDSKQDYPGIYEGKLREWTNKELQLNRLHEEILAKRESLLNSSIHYLRNQRARNTHASEAYVAERRNDKFLQDIIAIQTLLHQEATNPPSPRLTTLLVNYWSMVRSMKPLWEKSLDHTGSNPQQRHTMSSTPREQGSKVKQPSSSPSKTEKKKKKHKKIRF